jgi:ADP-heptose:LPS heptosyltransferase
LSEPERILVVRAGALGDTLMVTPLLRALRERFVDAEIDVLCSELARPLLELTPGLGRLFSLKWRNLPYRVSPEKRTLARELSRRRYAFAVLLERAPRYRKLIEEAELSSIRSFRETPFDPASHAVRNNLRAAGLDDAESSHDMEVFLSSSDRDRAAELLGELGAGEASVGLHIGYGPRAKKRAQSERLKGWALERFVELGHRLAERNRALVLTGSPEDRGDVDAVASKLSSSARVANLAGRTSVRELAAVIERLDLFVSVDSGPAHLAAAVGTPLIVLWGPAILEQVCPISSRSPVSVLRHPPPCAPCYDTPLMKTCRRNICMEAITPGEVALEVDRLLSR